MWISLLLQMVNYHRQFFFFFYHRREYSIPKVKALHHNHNFQSDYEKDVLRHICQISIYKSKNRFSLEMVFCLNHLVIFFSSAWLIILSKINMNSFFLVMGKTINSTEMNFLSLSPVLTSIFYLFMPPQKGYLYFLANKK